MTTDTEDQPVPYLPASFRAPTFVEIDPVNCTRCGQPTPPTSLYTTPLRSGHGAVCRPCLIVLVGEDMMASLEQAEPAPTISPPPGPAADGDGEPHPRTCPRGAHLAYADRTTEPWHWACRHCPATRAQRDPRWLS